MSQNMLLVCVLLVSVSLVGCNGTLVTNLDGGAASAATTIQSACSVTQTLTGATITCSDGTSATIANGSTSAVPQYRIRDANNAIIGTRAFETSKMFDDVEGTSTSYNSAGMFSEYLYFTDSNCATTPLVASNHIQNSVLANFGTRYKVSSTTIHAPIVIRKRDNNGVCAPSSLGGDFSQADVYTGNFPLAVAWPLRMEQF